MDITLSQLLYWCAIPCIAWVFKTLVINRIEDLEKKVESMVNETQVRQIISDKIDPIQADLTEIKSDVKSLFILQINERLSKDPSKD